MSVMTHTINYAFTYLYCVGRILGVCDVGLLLSVQEYFLVFHEFFEIYRILNLCFMLVLRDL
jgi:hypothetical protein